MTKKLDTQIADIRNKISTLQEMVATLDQKADVLLKQGSDALLAGEKDVSALATQRAAIAHEKAMIQSAIQSLRPTLGSLLPQMYVNEFKALLKAVDDARLGYQAAQMAEITEREVVKAMGSDDDFPRRIKALSETTTKANNELRAANDAITTNVRKWLSDLPRETGCSFDMQLLIEVANDMQEKDLARRLHYMNEKATS